MACLLMVMCLATVIKAEKPTRRAAASVVSTVKDIKESRSLNNSIAAVNENTRRLFNSAYIEIELVDSPRVIIRVLLDTGASSSCFSARDLDKLEYKLSKSPMLEPEPHRKYINHLQIPKNDSPWGGYSVLSGTCE